MFTINILLFLPNLIIIWFRNVMCENVDLFGSSRYRFDEYTMEQHQNYSTSMLCKNLRPQHSVDIQKISGLWYGNEIIMHTQDIPGEYQYHACVIAHISDITDEMMEYNRYNNNNYRNNYKTIIPISTLASTGTSKENLMGNDNSQRFLDRYVPAQNDPVTFRYIRFIWSENDDSNIEYHFNYATNRPGVWINIGEQQGSMVSLKQYTQFQGTVQIVNAMNNHLALTFCSSEHHHSIFTLVLSRQPAGLKLDVLRSIRNLLSKRGLYTKSIRKVCGEKSMSAGQASTLISRLLWAFVLTFHLAYTLRKFY